MQTKTQEQGKISLFPQRNEGIQPSVQVPEVLNLEDMVRNNLPSDCSDQDFFVCLETCRQYGLNPIIGEVNFLPQTVFERGREFIRYKPIVSRDGLMSLAHRSGNFDSIETEVTNKPWPTLRKEPGSNGQLMWVFYDIPQPVARCSVYRKGSERPFVAEVGFWEYAMGQNGQILSFWQNKPLTMIAKVAESQALRKAFHLSGLYIPEELNLGTADDSGVNLSVSPQVTRPSTSSGIEDVKPAQPERPATSLQVAPKALQEPAIDSPGKQNLSSVHTLSPPENTSAQKNQAEQTCPENPTPFMHFQAVTKDLLDAGLKDRTADWEGIHSGKVKVTEDLFFGACQPDKTVFYVWLMTSSPNIMLVDSLGFTQDPYSGWWSLNL